MADEEQVSWDQPEQAEQVSWDQPSGRERQRAFREQIRMGLPELAAQTSYGGEQPAVSLPPESPKTGTFLDRDEQGNLVAREMPITGGLKPEGVFERMSKAAKAGLGEEPFGISPETRTKYPWANTLQLAAYPADVLLRGLNAFVTGGAGAIAGAAEEMGMSREQADKLQRDIYQAAQVGAVEVPKPTPGMMTRPVVRAAETAAPSVERIEFMTGKPPVPEIPPVELPTVPTAEGIPVPEVRGKGARLLPPEIPHEPIALPERAGVGAEAAAGPLEGISPEAISQVARQLKADNWTPYTIDERLEKMSPHQFFAEVSPNLENKASQVAAYGGEGRNTIKTNVEQRHSEIKPRLKSLYDAAFGPVEDLAQKRKTLTIEQKAAADKFYKKFRDLEIHPTDELKEIMPRLEAAGAFGQAKKIAAVEGKPWEENFFTTGTRKNYPTAESWDYVKRALDTMIEGSFNQFGEPTNWTRIYIQLKNELIGAIDNHPNPEVAGVWKQARDAYAGPAKIKSSYELGKKVLSDSVDANELPFFTSSYSPKELEAIGQGIRYQLENQLGKAGAQEGRSIRQMLSENAQKKIRWIIGDEKAEKLFNAVDLENQIHGAQKRLIGGSPTAERMLGAEEEFGARPPRAAEIAGTVAETGMGLIKEPKKTVTKAISKFASEKMQRAAEEKAAKLRAEIAHIYTLQGPERDAALRWILEHGENWTGAPEIGLPGINRATGGSVLDKMRSVRHRQEGGGAGDSPFDDKAIAELPSNVPGTVSPETAKSVLKSFVPEFIQHYQASPDYDPRAPLPEAGKVPRNQPLTLSQMVVPAFMEGLGWWMPGGKAAMAAAPAIGKAAGVAAKAAPAAEEAAAKVARELSPLGFYSHGAETAAQLPQLKGTPEQIAAMLQKQGVKPAELEGFNEAFAGKPSVTREEAAQFFRERMPQVEETVLGVKEPYDAKRLDELLNEYKNLKEHPIDAPSFGEDKYNEMIRLLNIRDQSSTQSLYDAAERMITEGQRAQRRGDNVTAERYFRESELLNTRAEKLDLEGEGLAKPTKFGQYTLPGGENYREVLLKLPAKGPGTKPKEGFSSTEEARAFNSAAAQDFTGPHWDDPNVLAHVRMADRTGPNGEKILHVEEMQSDWGQKGRKEGFIGQPATELPQGALIHAPGEVPHWTNDAWTVQLPKETAGRSLFYGATKDEAVGNALEYIAKPSAKSVPSAPYVTSTQGWTDLALKRVLKEAAEGGYDRVVFTPGAEQAARYDLSKQVRSIDYMQEGKDSYRLGIIGKNGEIIDLPKETFTAKELEEYLGKDAAEKIINDQGRSYRGRNHKTLEGLDLKLGGKGMKGYYDKIMPAQLNKLVGKYDKQAKVRLGDYELPTKEGNTTQGHSIDITPKMREAILGGQTAFKRGGSVLDKMRGARRGQR